MRYYLYVDSATCSDIDSKFSGEGTRTAAAQVAVSLFGVRPGSVRSQGCGIVQSVFIQQREGYM